ncbi:hypothetical protein HDU98_010295 [Podochytrium sp. JEL0797]|nr:hypothetical protein HDU98_010295 [Podochytrium sp. JEL0797]
MWSQILAFLSFAVVTLATSNPGTALSVSGTGSVSLKADLAQVVVSVSALADTALQAQQATAANASSVLAVLNALNATKVCTKSISLSEQYTYNNGASIFQGFQSQITISFETGPKAAGKAIDSCIAHGVSGINSISFLANDENTAAGQKKAQADAIQDAVTQANTAAAQLDMCVKGISSINLTPQGSGGFAPAYKIMESATSSSSTPVVSSDISVSAQIDAVFQLASDC